MFFTQVVELLYGLFLQSTGTVQLDILVENMGRVNSAGLHINRQRKGELFNSF